MIEGSGSGSIPLTNGSGSGRTKNMWIRWIRNTGCYEKQPRKARGVDIFSHAKFGVKMDNKVHKIPRIISIGVYTTDRCAEHQLKLCKKHALHYQKVFKT